MPRTTLTIDDDALKVARAHASRHRMTLGVAVSELVRQAVDSRNGLVDKLSEESPLARRTPGSARGVVKVAADFDVTPHNFAKYMR